ncbi:MAG: autotransporter assembly complex family protein [Spongiibacteraceae bacterium]|jgi:translocation and assembly module TamA|nr:autotransporter assembly complex family protein [Spongiibacteraceae bacterium]
MLRTALLLILLVGANAYAATELVVRGAPEALATNIRAHLDLSDIRPGNSVVSIRRLIREDVQRAGRALGYYHMQVDYSWQGDTLQLAVQPGPRLVWSEPEIATVTQDKPAEAVRAAIRQHPFTADTPFLHATYDQYKSTLLRTAEESGFLNAAYTTSTLLIDTTTNQARAVLTLRLGEAHHIRHIGFSGSRISESVLRQITGVSEGALFTSAVRNEMQRNLETFGAFKRVSVTIARDQAASIDIHIELEDKPGHEFQVGLGFGTDTGVRTRFRWIWPVVNDAAHRMSTELKISEPEQTLTTSYYIPLADPLTQNLEISATWERQDIEDTDSNSVQLGVTLNDALTDDWLVGYSTKLIYEDYQQGNEPRTSQIYLLPGISLDHLVLAQGLDPRTGHRTWLSADFSNEELGADIQFLRLNAGYKRLLPVADRHDLIGRLELGVLLTDDIQQVPASQRFFTGGDQTVRGYDYQSIGPKDADGSLIGGKYLNVVSLEYNYRLFTHWKVALFTDAGRAFNDGFNESWRRSVGVGIRWLSPIGQIRIDVATPVESEESGFRLHIFMGPAL